jgi:phospholipase C
MKVFATLSAAAAATLLLAGGTSASNPRSTEKNYQHVFVIMMENTGFGTLVGNRNAPWINGAIAKYGWRRTTSA